MAICRPDAADAATFSGGNEKLAATLATLAGLFLGE